jgi:tRNA pseudouridine38-40 synthase
VIAFEADWGHPVDALQRALNVNLSRDVAIRELEACAEQFSPRLEARSRTYVFTAYVSPVRSPLRDRFAWHIEREPDIAVMNAAARLLTGTHDFAAFGSPTGASDGTVRTVMRAEWRMQESVYGPALTFEIEANAFLYRMVRRIVNALVKTGLSRLSVEEVKETLASRDQNRITGLAPACGLCLVDVSYQV